jgi:RepB DNA-primase from phage plasmid
VFVFVETLRKADAVSIANPKHPRHNKKPPALNRPGQIVITRFTKSDGSPLTKKIWLEPDGSIASDRSACVLARGVAERITLASLEEFAELLDRMGRRSDQALALGRLRAGLPTKVKLVTKDELDGPGLANVMARTGRDIVYRKGQQALALLDHDTKGMPADVKAKLQQLGGFWPALLSVLPALRGVARVSRPSTSSGLYRDDTGAPVKESDGMHVYILVLDGADIERFLRALHMRFWLAGFGWLIVDASGKLLERSLIDRIVGGPERLCFEGKPILEPPLRQKLRRTIVVDGVPLDTATHCPPLTSAEIAKFAELKEQQRQLLAAKAAKARIEWHNARADTTRITHTSTGSRKHDRRNAIENWWRQQPGRFISLATKTRDGQWQDYFFERDQVDLAAFIAEHADKNCYFCPHLYARPHKNKTNAVRPQGLWSDLDVVDVMLIEPEPSVVICTSPGRYQALWSTDEPITEQLNQRLSYHIRADLSGWDLTQSLRLPGTLNYKYNPPSPIIPLWADGPRYRVSELEQLLPPLAGADCALRRLQSSSRK